MLGGLADAVATTPEDGRALKRVTGRETVRVATNGVELPDLDARPGEDDAPLVLFTGVLSFPPNIEAARYFAKMVWPAVREAVPRARFVIAGRTPAPEVERLAARPGIELRPHMADMTDEIRRSWVAVAPMRTAGIKNKVLEAGAAERPVVLSNLATTGLHLNETLRETVTADERKMAAAVVRLLRDELVRRRLGSAGRRVVADGTPGGRPWSRWRTSWTMSSAPQNGLSEQVRTHRYEPPLPTDGGEARHRSGPADLRLPTRRRP